MNAHPTFETLNDLIDGQLPEPRQREVEQHLGECTDCAHTVVELRSLASRAAALGDIEPSLDLIPGIRDAVVKPGRPWIHWAAVAAALLVVFVGFQRLGRDEIDPAPDSGEPVAMATLMAEFRNAEAQYVQATERLLQGFEQRRGEIPPETLLVIDDNLKIIDSAIAEVRSSLDDEGIDPGRGHALTALYGKKLQILWRASRLWS